MCRRAGGRRLAAVVDPIGISGLAFDAAPSAARALNVIVGEGSVAKLRGSVAGDLRSAQEIAPGRRRIVGFRPQVGGRRAARVECRNGRRTAAAPVCATRSSPAVNRSRRRSKLSIRLLVEP
jgi:hypothetical protein